MSSEVIDGVMGAIPIERTNYETMAYERIKYAIIHKELKPGEKVSYISWSEQLKISRTPVRDALKRLEYEGLIVRETERQWHVYTLSLDEIYDIFDARAAVEARIAALAALRITPEEVVALDHILALMEETRKNNDYETFYHINNDFHKLLNRACRNEFLVTVSERLNERLSRIYPRGINIEGRHEKSFQENLLIADALKKHDPEAAEDAQASHLHSYRDHLVRVIKEMMIPFIGPVF